MSNNPSPDEQPKRRIAKKLVTPKRRYFVPSRGVSVEASDARAAAKAGTKQVKAGDEQ